MNKTNFNNKNSVTFPTTSKKYNFSSIRDSINPRIQFNLKSILLISIALVPLSLLSFTTINGINIPLLSYNNPPRDSSILVLNNFFMFLIVDFFISGLILKPIRYIKYGYTVGSSKDISLVFINQHLPNSEVKKFLLLIIPRIFIYLLLIMFYGDLFNPDLNTDYRGFILLTFFTMWLTTASLIIMFLVTLVLIGIGLLIDDYLNEGSTFVAVQDLKKELSSTTAELDKIINIISDPQRMKYGNKSMPKQYRSTLANSLFKLRNFLNVEPEQMVQKEPAINSQNMEYIKAEESIANELLESLKKDKCVVCYATLENARGLLLACPVCGQGGHKDHINSWFQMGKTECPTCKSNVQVNNFLVLEADK